MRATRAHRDNRRSHHSLKNAQLAACAKCKSPLRSHTACAVCGTYKGRQVIDVLKKTKKIEARNKRKADEKKLG